MTATAGSPAAIAGDLADIRGGLAWALGLDLSGTAIYAAIAAWSALMLDPGVPIRSSLALVAGAGACLAAVSVAISIITLRRAVPSARALRASIGVAVLGLVVNTVGCVVVLSSSPPDHVGAALLLLLLGDALAIIYVVLGRNALGLVRALRGTTKAL